MFKACALATLMSLALPAWCAGPLPLASTNVLVVDDVTGEPLLQKDAMAPVSIASLTKLVTAMVVLDARQDLGEFITITTDDLDTLKNTKRGLEVGSRLPRQMMLELALQTSDNHAAAALGRTFPGGHAGFVKAARDKTRALGLQHTVIVEPTGLSPLNQSTAVELAVLMQAAASYPLIGSATRQPTMHLLVDGRQETVQNTNRLVGQAGWNILLSKTGYTNEAGRCLVMRLQEAGRVVRVVLLGGFERDARTLDALNIRRWLRGEEALAALPQTAVKVATRSTLKKAGLKKNRAKARMPRPGKAARR